MIDKDVQARSNKTAAYLKKIATDPQVRNISRLTLPQIEEVISEIVAMLPGDDLPTFILRGLTSLPDAHVSPQQVEKDTALLVLAWNRLKSVALFGTFFAGPAAVILVYQKLLQLAGKTADLAFPEGQWQFYVNYALREDAARHTHETAGFDRLLDRHSLKLARVDRLTAWILAAIEILFEYPLILRNEWRERIYLKTLRDVVGINHEMTQRIASASQSWEQHRPYRRGPDVLPGESYPHYRQRKFDDFMAVYLSKIDEKQRRSWLERVNRLKGDELPHFQQQMSIRATLRATLYMDEKIPLELADCRVGLIFNGRYYLIPVTRPRSQERPDSTIVRSQVAAILAEGKMAGKNGESTDLTSWARCPRAKLPEAVGSAPQSFVTDLESLQKAPILINGDVRDGERPLAQIRQGERGIGAHPITIFDTGHSAVFDLSHIFFDGLWGAAVSEMITAAATAWAVYLHSLPPIHPPVTLPTRLNFDLEKESLRPPFQKAGGDLESGAETDQVHLRNLLALRRVFKLRNDLIRLTVNDILVLYRSIHTRTYKPAPELLARLKALSTQPKQAAAALAALAELDPGKPLNPTMLIPVDASRHNPRDRVFPLCFQVPVAELQLVELHRQVIDALNDYHQLNQNRGDSYEMFDRLQRRYLGVLAGLGVVFAEAKQAASRGETISVKTINLLAHLPRPIQHLLDRIPDRIAMINHLIKGEEVFSNIGVVSNASSLRRFLSAKDDNPGKRMAWGVLTDAQLTMRITLRDFRPHVPLLVASGERELAQRLTSDYLVSYTQGLNSFVNDLRRITMASRETKLAPDLGLVHVRST